MEGVVDVGVVIVLNILSIPFWNEIDVILEKNGRLWPRVLFLSETRKQRWFWGYLVLLAIFVGISAMPTPSQPAELGLYFSVFIAQGILAITAYTKHK